MDNWRADYVNNPDDDFNIVLEILYNDTDIATIYRDQYTGRLDMKIYAHDEDLLVSVDFLSGILRDISGKI